jgi:hypothetical protein
MKIKRTNNKMSGMFVLFLLQYGAEISLPDKLENSLASTRQG